jgi:hypothetical protein
MNPLAKVSDGTADVGIARATTFHLLTVGPWIALWLGVRFIHGGGLALFMGAVVALAGWAMFKRIPEASAMPEPGVWLTSRMGLWSRWLDRSAPVAGLILSVLVALVAWARGASTWGVGYLFFLALVFGVQAAFVLARTSPARVVELRIDSAGFYSRLVGGVLTWDQIREIQSRVRGDRKVLRLLVTANTAPGLSAACRARGGPIAIALDDAGVSRDAVVAAIAAMRPSLDPAAEARCAAFVQPIEGVYVDQPVETDSAVAAPVLAGLAIGMILN